MRVNNNKGMTLIALLITIIVLFLLAGVAISSITGEGLFGLGSHQNEAINKEQELNDELKNQVIGTLDKTEANHNELISDYMCKEHNWNSGTETKPTCTQNGEIIYECTNKYCTATRPPEVIPALGHNWDSGTETKPATCTEKGEITKTCQRCGKKEKTETSEAEHTWDSGTLSALVNCTYKRTKTYECTKCGESKTEEVNGKSHTSDGGTVTREATCTENGSIIYKCKVCKISYGTGTINKLGHSWIYRTTKVATCTEKGEQTRSCTRCTVEQTYDIAATGHSLEVGTETKLATCITEGERPVTCKNCTYSTTQTTGYDPSNHYKTSGKYTTEKYYNPDYTPGKNSAGQVVHYYDEICSRCKSEVYPITEKNEEHCAPYWEVIGGPYRAQAYYNGVKYSSYGCDHIQHVAKVKCTICDQMSWHPGFHYIANTTTFTCSCGRYMGDIWPEDGDWSKLTVYNPYANTTNPPDPREWTGHTVNALGGVNTQYYNRLGWVQSDGWTKEDFDAAICPVEGCNKQRRADYDNIY